MIKTRDEDHLRKELSLKEGSNIRLLIPLRHRCRLSWKMVNQSGSFHLVAIKQKCWVGSSLKSPKWDPEECPVVVAVLVVGMWASQTNYKIRKALISGTYCVLNVNAALVMLDGKCNPLIISCHNFLLMTSTSPPRAITKLYNSYKSNTDFAIIGNRLIGVPVNEKKIKNY